MAVVSDRKTVRKLISVNSNENLIPVAEKKISKDPGRLPENDPQNQPPTQINTTTQKNSLSNVGRPCSGSSILKRSARPSSGHSVKFVGKETIISLENATGSPVSGTSLSNSDFKKISLETITQQEPLELHNHLSQEAVIPLESRISTPSTPAVPAACETMENNGMSCGTKANENELKLNYNETDIKEVNIKQDNDRHVDFSNENDGLDAEEIGNQQILKHEEGEEIHKDTKTKELSSENTNDLPGASGRSSIHDSDQAKKHHPQRESSYNQKRIIYNTEICPTSGDMLREGCYKTKGSEFEKQHYRHKNVKHIMSEKNAHENGKDQFDEMELDDGIGGEIEREIVQTKMNSRNISAQKKKKLCELYEELKRVRDAIAHMYSFEEEEKDISPLVTENAVDENEEEESQKNITVCPGESKGSEKSDIEKENSDIESDLNCDTRSQGTHDNEESYEKSMIEGSEDYLDMRQSSEKADDEETEMRENCTNIERESKTQLDMQKDENSGNEKENNKLCEKEQKDIVKNEVEKVLLEESRSPENDVENSKSELIEKDSACSNNAEELVRDCEEETKTDSTDEIQETNTTTEKHLKSTMEAKTDKGHDGKAKNQIKMKSKSHSTDKKIHEKKNETHKTNGKQNQKTSHSEESRKGKDLKSKCHTKCKETKKSEVKTKSMTTHDKSLDRTEEMHGKDGSCLSSNDENESRMNVDVENNVTQIDKNICSVKDNVEKHITREDDKYRKDNVINNEYNKDEQLTNCDTINRTTALTETNLTGEKFNRDSSVKKISMSEPNIVDKKSKSSCQLTSTSTAAGQKAIEKEKSLQETKDQNISSSFEDYRHLASEVNLDFVIDVNYPAENNRKGADDSDRAMRESFSDSALMMSPMKDRDDDYFDYDDDISDNDSFTDIPKVADEKKSKEATNVANKIIKDILCNISDMQENRQFKKEFKTMTTEQEEMSCIIISDPDDTFNVDLIKDMNCSNIDPLIVPSLVGEYELLVSSVTQLSTSINNDLWKIKLKVRIPFMKSEMKYFHRPVLRWLSSERKWIEIPSVEYLYEDEDGCILPILEAEVKQLGIFAIVATTIKEHFVFGHNVHEVSSAVDRETTLAGTYCPRFYKTETEADLVVIPIERSVIDDSKTPDIEDSSLLVSSSALVVVELLNDPPQPLTLYILCSKPKSRPWTASMTSRIGTSESGYLSGSRIVSRAKSRESINHFLECWYDSDNYLVRMTGGCLGVKSMLLQKKDLTKDDKIQVTLHEKHNMYLIVEMKKEARRPDVNSVVVNLIKTLKEHRIYVCVAQRRDDPRHIRVSCDLKTKVTTRMINRLEKDHNIRRTLIHAKEGDVISLGLRGNITTIPKRKRIFRFYAMNGFVADWEIQVVYPYCQRSLREYCGFVQVSVCTSDSFEDDPISGYEEYVKWKLLTEIPVTLPKDSSLYSCEKTLKARLCLTYKGPITIEFLRSLARLIGKEWYILARGLHLEHVRIQSIAQQNKRCSLESLVYDILLAWLKRSRHCSDKAVNLASALKKSGRIDLAKEISDMDRSFKRDYYKTINERRLDKAIHLASKSHAVIKSWKHVGSFLQLREEDIVEIDATESNEFQKCERMLNMWRSRNQSHQGPQMLIVLLKKAGYCYVADHIAVATRWRPKTSV
ncbi:uncharacterized protein LOC134270353 [Saccostrea cucullata]|uniref:uncharacterized protein LOC134270353 n=1 Tax=Saccostrea cuccullata TaxID=36930 RepID=UPI002ED20897